MKELVQFSRNSYELDFEYCKLIHPAVGLSWSILRWFLLKGGGNPWAKWISVFYIEYYVQKTFFHTQKNFEMVGIDVSALNKNFSSFYVQK